MKILDTTPEVLKVKRLMLVIGLLAVAALGAYYVLESRASGSSEVVHTKVKSLSAPLNELKNSALDSRAELLNVEHMVLDGQCALWSYELFGSGADPLLIEQAICEGKPEVVEATEKAFRLDIELRVLAAKACRQQEESGTVSQDTTEKFEQARQAYDEQVPGLIEKIAGLTGDYLDLPLVAPSLEAAVDIQC